MSRPGLCPGFLCPACPGMSRLSMSEKPLKGRRRQVLELLRRSGPLSSMAIARRLGLSQSTVYVYLRHLRQLDLAAPSNIGNGAVWRFGPAPKREPARRPVPRVNSIWQLARESEA